MKKYSIVLSLVFLLFFSLYVYNETGKIKHVTASKMKQENYCPTINITGEFKSCEQTYIIMSLPLCIKNVYVKENSYVNKGQALFSIDKEKMASILTNGLSEDIISLLETSDLNRLKTRINSFKQANILNLPDTVYAAENGIISSVNIFSGGFALPNQQLMVITHTDDILAKFTLSQIDYGKINIGDKVEINPIAFDGITYTGTIAEDNAVIKKQSTVVGSKTVVDVFANIENADDMVADGLQINGIVYCGNPQIINTLDYNFIYQDEKGQYVFVLENGYAVRKYIEPGIETNEFIQVLTHFSDNTIFLFGDIKDGDRVIIGE